MVIACGPFEPGTPLPHTEQLLDRYGVSYPTLRKALGKLAADGMLSQRGHSFIVTPPSAMLTYVTDPFSQAFGKTRSRVVEIDGWVVERSSSS